mmetsp:Transcript_18399/g.58080  ORF Transcript_18399/g.58080 Transcript_18399/m.58080 type:complete len:243 (-) Transcript_18399:970-1698(-)
MPPVVKWEVRRTSSFLVPSGTSQSRAQTAMAGLVRTCPRVPFSALACGEHLLGRTSSLRISSRLHFVTWGRLLQLGSEPTPPGTSCPLPTLLPLLQTSWPYGPRRALMLWVSRTTTGSTPAPRALTLLAWSAMPVCTSWGHLQMAPPPVTLVHSLFPSGPLGADSRTTSPLPSSPSVPLKTPHTLASTSPHPTSNEPSPHVFWRKHALRAQAALALGSWIRHGSPVPSPLSRPRGMHMTSSW